MKLSEKLAALEEEEGREARAVPTDDTPRRAKPVRSKDSGSPWDETKRKVRGLVLEEIADKIKALDADEREAALREALDGILQREDISVTPLERRRFVAEMVADTLGYGPLDPLLADPDITEMMCNAYDDIWVERRGRHRADRRPSSSTTPSTGR